MTANSGFSAETSKTNHTQVSTSPGLGPLTQRIGVLFPPALFLHADPTSKSLRTGKLWCFGRPTAGGELHSFFHSDITGCVDADALLIFQNQGQRLLRSLQPKAFPSGPALSSTAAALKDTLTHCSLSAHTFEASKITSLSLFSFLSWFSRRYRAPPCLPFPIETCLVRVQSWHERKPRMRENI